MEVLGFNVPLWAVLVVVVLYVYYKYQTWKFGLFKELGIKGPRPVPVFGNLALFTGVREGIDKFDDNLIGTYGKVCGFFLGREPTLLVADTGMLREILVKRFDCFQNRRRFGIDEEPMNLMLTLLTDDHWKHVRSLMSPTFSMGKLKRMNGLINHSGRVLVKNLLAKAEKGDTIEFRETAGFYTMDVLGSTAFGLMIDSQEDPENEFVKMAKKAMDQGISLLMLIIFFAPGLIKYASLVGLRLSPKDAVEFFSNMTKKTIEAREKEPGQKRADLLQLMLNVRSDDLTDDIGGVGGDVSHLAIDRTGLWSKKYLTEEEILAQCVLFFIAGYDTTSSMISFLAYNLAVNPACQDTLKQEIDRVMEGETEPGYELVQKMTYLDLCLQESLRVLPVASRTDRQCQKDVTINGQFIPKGMNIAIPNGWLLHDPSVWPEPHVFRPERFTPEEKADRDPLYHIPFGYGPRSCIAMRLALFECKMCMVHILQNFKIVTCDETQIPLVRKGLRMRPEKGIHLKLQKRN